MRNTTDMQRVQLSEPLSCEHLTFVTCRTCGKTYQQRMDEAQRRSR
jgi:hypothetical protein